MDVSKEFIVEYLIYLRKSRADLEAEARGEGETLARHETALLDLAKRMSINITAIYKEIVSGETIAERPVMQQVLKEVESGRWAGVLVMEVERLARGDTKDQGTVAQAFKYSDTKIITPVKTYDPNNEFDEEYFEFGLFMSRREFKTINRRIQRGRIASVKEGKYISSVAPYGYDRVKLYKEKGYTLKINEEQGKVINMIYDLYVYGETLPDGSVQRLGCTRIAKKLNELGLKPMIKDIWTKESITDILKNPVYNGKIKWQTRKEVKKLINNVIVRSRPSAKEYMLNNGLHPALIDSETWNSAQEIMKQRGKPPVRGSDVLKNPIAGIVRCDKCGTIMTRLAPNKKTAYDTLKCPNIYCDNVSSPLELVEDAIIDGLEEWLKNYKFEFKNEEYNLPFKQSIVDNEHMLNDINSQVGKVEKQFDKTYELLEQGVYTLDIFQDRRKKITDQLNVLIESRNKIMSELGILKNNFNKSEILIPKIEHLLDVYYDMDSAESRNQLLKDVLEKVVYLKTSPNKKGERLKRNFTIDLYPKTTKF